MLTVLHVSDIHFGPPFRPQIAEKLLDIVPELAPDVLVFSGDFTQRATEEQFRDARAYIDRFPQLPRIVVPGNHDVPLYRLTERLLDPMGLYRKYIHAELNHTVETDGAFFVALDSTAPRRTITNGRIDAEQLAFCTEAFSQAPQGALRVVVAHHPFTSAPDYARDRMMPHRKRTLQHFTDLGVDMILGGHLHRAYVGNSLDTLDLERTRGIVIAQSGTTTSGRGRAREKKKNTFNLITVSRETICVQHYVFSATDDRFQPFAQHLFPRHGFPFAPG